MAYSNSSDFSTSMSMTQDSDFLVSLKPPNTTSTQDSEEIVEMYCEDCHSNNKYSPAIAFCPECVEYFCRESLRFHKRFLPDHKHVENNDMPEDVCIEKCPIHSDQIIKFYCDGCDKFACKTCKGNNHSSCRKVDHVPNLVKDIEKGQELRGIVQGLQTISNKLQGIKTAVEMNTTKVKKSRDDATSAIESQKENIVKKVEKNKDKLNAKVEAMKVMDDKRLKSVFSRYSKMKSEVDKLKQLINNQKQATQRCKLFITLKKSNKDVKDFETELNNLTKENVVQEYKFEPGMTLKTLAENEMEFGKIVSDVKSGKMAKDTFLQDINVKAENEELDCAIWSLCLVSDNFLIVCDGRNCSIKSIDLKTNQIKSVLPMNNPICLSQTSYNKLVVSCISASELTFLSVSISGILHLLDQKINTEMPCWDIVCKNDQFIVALFQVKSPSAGKIQILSKTGAILHSILTNFRGKIFRISKIALSSDQTTLYMIDLMKDVVVKMTVDGDVKALYENENLRQLNGLVTSKSGSVYICDSGSYKIHALSADCSSCTVKLDQSHGLWRPISVTFSDTDGKLYVGQAHQNSIKVYKL